MLHCWRVLHSCVGCCIVNPGENNEYLSYSSTQVCVWGGVAFRMWVLHSAGVAGPSSGASLLPFKVLCEPLM